MKRLIIVIAVLCISACSSNPVKQNKQFVLTPLFYAKVLTKTPVELTANESKTNRILVGLVTAGIVGAIATANTESGFSTPKAFAYDLIADGQALISHFNSFSDIAKGTCVKVIKMSNAKLVLLSPVAKSLCVRG